MLRNFLFILFANFIAISIASSCTDHQNYCQKCNPLLDQCIICSHEDILVPNENGVCEGSQKCFIGKNYCLECESDEKLCKTCDVGYYPDANGACSNTASCKISYKGICLECQEDYILIEPYKNCKSLLNNDFKNCKEIDILRGVCKECEEGYYLDDGDKKCSKTENCFESMFGVCQLCNYGYYLNRKENKCIEKNGDFLYCKQTIDGETCDLCNSGSYMDENGVCVQTNFCSKSSNGKCDKCKDGYYLSYNNGVCINTDKCYIGDKDTGLCLECNLYYYIDFKDFKCRSNVEANEYKFCEKVIDNICVKCESGYYLGKDGKCSFTPNCEESDNGFCNLCAEKYYLGLDAYCSEIERCIYSRFNDCIECQDGYYYHSIDKKCIKSEGVQSLENCKYTCKYPDSTQCCECKNNYYLDSNKTLCNDNNEEGAFYKCRYADKDGEKCRECVEGYHLGSEDKKCTLNENCKISENENRCLECDDYFCLDVKSGKCIRNEFLENEKVKIYFACKKTNKEGEACEQCIEGYEVNDEGYCVNMANCEENKDGKCMKCNNEKNKNGYYYCANEVFGCIEGHFGNCIRCDNLLDLYSCTECENGYEKNQYGACVLKS